MQQVISENKMGVQPVGTLLTNMAIPMMISMLVQAFYNIVDSVFVSRISEHALTAVSLAFPLQTLCIAVGSGTAVGMNAILSRSLGEKRQDLVDKSANTGIFLFLCSYVVFALIGVFLVKPFFLAQTDVEEILRHGIAYSSICLTASIGIFMQFCFERLLQSTGRTSLAMVTQVVGAVTNIILDPILIFGLFGLPRMEVAGAAIATVIGQWVAAIMAVIFNFTSNPDVHFAVRYLKPKADIVKKILAVGVPSIIMMAIGSVMNFCMNQIFMGFKDSYGQTPATVFGIYFRLQSFFFMPLFGINNASISIIAYNYGAQQPKRITKTLKLALGSAMVIMLLGLAVFQAFPDVLMGIFGSAEDAGTQDLVKLGISALRIVSIHFPIAAVGIALGASFQALGNGIYSTITSLCRQLVVLVPAAYLLSLTGNVDAVWWSFPLAEVVSGALTVIFFIRIYRQKVKPIFAE